MVTVVSVTAWQDSPLPLLRRIADLLCSAQDLPDPISAPGLEEVEEVLARRNRYTEINIDRSKLSSALANDHRARGAPPESIKAAESLVHPEAYLVIAGQQPGLLLGPLYTLVKCIQAVNLARRLENRGLGKIVPAFWNASEDHDHGEIDRVVWLDRDREPTCYRADLHGLPERLSIWAIPKERVRIDRMVALMRDSFCHEAHTQPLIDCLRQTYRSAGGSLADWFDQLLWRLLPGTGLLVIRPESPFLRNSVQRVLRREIRQPLECSAEVNRAGDELERLGLARQIHKTGSRVSFFLVEDAQRLALTYLAGRFVASESRWYSPEELESLLLHHPEYFSSSAILRPIVQDASLPTIATVLGPHELLYHLQLGEVYNRHGIPRPALVPRNTIAFLEPYDLKILSKTGLSPAELNQDVKSLVRRVVRSREGKDYAQLRERVEDHVRSAYEQLAEWARAIDPTLLPILDRQRRQITKVLQDSEALLIRRRADRETDLHRRLERVARLLYPLDQPQERVLGIVQFMARYGLDLPSQMLAALADVPPGTQTFLGLA